MEKKFFPPPDPHPFSKKAGYFEEGKRTRPPGSIRRGGLREDLLSHHLKTMLRIRTSAPGYLAAIWFPAMDSVKAFRRTVVPVVQEVPFLRI